MKVSVVVFPGSNCDHDMVYTYGSLLNARVETIWHQESDLKNPDLVVVPGGFSYGDYLRTGALAKLSPVMKTVSAYAASGGPVLGVCNGFQILCEAGLLPGVLFQNVGMRFISKILTIKAESTDSLHSRGITSGQTFKCPVAHFDGNYFAETEVLKKLEDNGQVAFRYCAEDGSVNTDCRESNPNGSINSIAGVFNEKKNVLGMMPHPERSSEKIVGYLAGDQGRQILSAAINPV